MPSDSSRDSPLKGSHFHHPKRSQRISRIAGCKDSVKNIYIAQDPKETGVRILKKNKSTKDFLGSYWDDQPLPATVVSEGL